jgi:hypothetical protein
MTRKIVDDQYSDAETQKRLDSALRRSLKMPPPAKKPKPSRAKETSRKARKTA